MVKGVLRLEDFLVDVGRRRRSHVSPTLIGSTPGQGLDFVLKVGSFITFILTDRKIPVSTGHLSYKFFTFRT